jgi:hypothetical protein
MSSGVRDAADASCGRDDDRDDARFCFAVRPRTPPRPDGLFRQVDVPADFLLPADALSGPRLCFPAASASPAIAPPAIAPSKRNGMGEDAREASEFDGEVDAEDDRGGGVLTLGGLVDRWRCRFRRLIASRVFGSQVCARCLPSHALHRIGPGLRAAFCPVLRLLLGFVLATSARARPAAERGVPEAAADASASDRLLLSALRRLDVGSRRAVTSSWEEAVVPAVVGLDTVHERAGGRPLRRADRTVMRSL